MLLKNKCLCAVNYWGFCLILHLLCISIINMLFNQFPVNSQPLWTFRELGLPTDTGFISSSWVYWGLLSRKTFKDKFGSNTTQWSTGCFVTASPAVAVWLWTLPVWEELHGFDMESLSGSDVLAVGKFHRPPHSTWQTLIQPGGACCCH